MSEDSSRHDAIIRGTIEWCEQQGKAAAAAADGFDYHAGAVAAYGLIAAHLRKSFPAAARQLSVAKEQGETS